MNGLYGHGDRNLANPGSLRYIPEASQGSFLAIGPYPKVISFRGRSFCICCTQVLDRHTKICYRRG